MRLLIIIPAFNESKVIYDLLKSIPKKFKGISFAEKIVINDGSTDSTLLEIKKSKTKYLNHIINRGLGAVIKTGLEYAKKNNFDIAVTFDSDGQHNPTDINRIIEPILNKKSDLTIGSRFLKSQKMPIDRLIINWVANIITFIFYGVFVTDSQSGLRAFSKKAIKVIDYKADRMDFSSEILLEAKRNNLRINEIPIKATYTQYSRSKGQKNSNAFPIFARFLVRLLR